MENKNECMVYRALQYLAMKDLQVKNKAMDGFIAELQRVAKENGGEYIEQKHESFPMELSPRSILLLFPQEIQKEVHPAGMIYCDLLIYNYEEYFYFKLTSKFGFLQTFVHNVKASHFIMDGFSAIEIRDPFILDLDTVHNMILNVFQEDTKLDNFISFEVIKLFIKNNPKVSEIADIFK